MSAIERIKAQIRAQKHVHQYGQDMQMPYHGGPQEIVVLPKKKAIKRRKLMEVQQEHKDCMDNMPSKGCGGLAFPKKKEDELDDEEVMEDDDGYNDKPKLVPWGPAELMNHLDKPETACNIERVIELVKQKEQDVPLTREDRQKGQKGERKKETIVWDHSKSGLGKKSDNNFFLWLQAYSAHEDKLCQQQENMIFN